MLNPYDKHLIATIAVIGTLLLANACHAELKSTKIPRYDAAVAKAVSFLQRAQKVSARDSTLVAYALLKAGVPQSDPKIVAGLQRAKDIAAANNFGSYHPLYEASVAAILLADADAEANRPDLQRIVDRIISFQRPNGSWSAESSGESPDVSLMQYCVLAIWAAQRSDCKIPPEAVDRVTNFFAASANADGGWRYRPGSNLGPEKGRSSHNMTLAAVGSLSIGRLFLYGVENKKPEPKVLGVLTKAESGTDNNIGVFGDYKPRSGLTNINGAIRRGVQWNETRFSPIPHTEFPLYFYYTLERAAALTTFRSDWFTVYGDALLTLQSKDGSFSGRHTEVSSSVATSFAILFYMRATQQILDKQYASGLQAGGRLDDLREKKKKKELGPLDELLAQMQDVDFDQLDGIDAEAVAEKIAFGSREELIGQLHLLKKLRKHPDAQNRIAAYFALGRTGDFALVPDILKGLRDPNIDVNDQALDALRYLSRKPNGFGITLTPFAGAELADDKTRLKIANAWRTKAFKTWGTWYRSVRPFEESGGLDELELRATSKQ